MPTVQLPTGVDLYYEVHGQGDPLVLIPATGFSGEVWQPYQVPALSEHLQVIIFDQRGTGRSGAPGGVYSIDQMAADTIALLNHLNIGKAHVLGHSMGGRIGLAMALDFPGRVKSLVLAASGSGPAARIGDECIPGLPYHLVHDWVQLGFEEFVRHEVMETTTYFTDEYRRNHPDKVRAFYDLVWPTHAQWPAYLRLCLARHNWEATHRLGDVSVPTLVVIGDLDVIGSNHVPQSEVMAQRIPNAQLMVLKGQSHGFFWEVPEETNAWILNWVREHS